MNRSTKLVVIVVFISMASIALTLLRLADIISPNSATILAYGLFVLNLVAALVGVSTNWRAAWMAYSGVSLFGMLAVSAATPLSAAFLATRLLFKV